MAIQKKGEPSKTKKRTHQKTNKEKKPTENCSEQKLDTWIQQKRNKFQGNRDHTKTTTTTTTTLVISGKGQHVPFTTTNVNTTLPLHLTYNLLNLSLQLFVQKKYVRIWACRGKGRCQYLEYRWVIYAPSPTLLFDPPPPLPLPIPHPKPFFTLLLQLIISKIKPSFPSPIFSYRPPSDHHDFSSLFLLRR